MENQPDRDKIRDEAIGQARDAPPESVTGKEQLSPEEAARRLARAPGPEASMPEKTAASIGERAGGAYADAGSARQKHQGTVDQPIATESGWNAMANCALSAGRELAESISDQFSDQRFLGLVAVFGLGIIAATLLRGRQ